MKKTIVHVISRTCSLNGWLAKWLCRHAPDFNIIFSPYSVEVGRNLSVETFLKLDDGDFLIQMDDDIYPLETTKNIFKPQDDVITYCGCPTRSVRGYNADGLLVPNCMCIPRTILEKIDPPWFLPRVTKSGSGWVKSEVRYFLEKLQKIGYTTKVVGQVGHISQVVLHFEGTRIAITQPKWIV